MHSYFVNSLSKLAKLDQILNDAIYFELRPQILCSDSVESMLLDGRRKSFLLPYLSFFDNCITNDFCLLCASRVVIVNHFDNLISQSANRTQSSSSTRADFGANGVTKGKPGQTGKSLRNR